MKKKGFTIIELLSVLLILSILMAIAVPSIMAISNKMQLRGLEKKIEAIESAAVVYTQNNSNKIKREIAGSDKCNKVTPWCECEKPNDCKYIYKMTVNKLIEVGAYKSENPDNLENKCNVEDPTTPNRCLDNVEILIKLDDVYKTASAYIDKKNIK